MAEFSKLSGGKGDLNSLLADVFKKMLENQVFDAILVPARQSAKGVMQTLITDPARLDSIDPFAPVVPVNSAKLVSNLTNVPSGRPVGVVMRSCEVRALLELVKLNQANVEDLILIGIDCLGRYENPDFLRLEQEDFTTESFLEASLNGKETEIFQGIDVTPACKICEYPVPDNVDIRLCLIGSGPHEIYIEWVSEKGKKVLHTIGLESGDGPSGRDESIEKTKSQRITERDRVFTEHYEQVNTVEKLQEYLTGCINCYNCRVACPVCYCKECVFVTDTFRHPGDQYMSWGDNRGAVKMPAETILYHMTRMTHMSTLCVGCGQCTSACPNDIQLAELFRSVANRTQARFDYHPGRSPDEPQPLAVFYDDEFTDVTGQVK